MSDRKIPRITRNWPHFPEEIGDLYKAIREKRIQVPDTGPGPFVEDPTWNEDSHLCEALKDQKERNKKFLPVEWTDAQPADFLPGGAFWGGHTEIPADELARWIERGIKKETVDPQQKQWGLSDAEG
jgi:hypothetical protein